MVPIYMLRKTMIHKSAVVQETNTSYPPYLSTELFAEKPRHELATVTPWLATPARRHEPGRRTGSQANGFYYQSCKAHQN